MNRRALELLLWAVTGLALALACTAARGVGRPGGPQATPIPVGSALPPRLDLMALAPAITRVDAGDPFRLDRSPAPMATPQGGPTGVPTPPPSPALRPPLAVQGIVGPPWQAVLEGIPGQSGSVVVHGGERFGPLQVRSITRDQVVVAGPDTVWRLTVRNPWH